eukprot:4922058-Karenia_brevis.AAC.1
MRRAVYCQCEFPCITEKLCTICGDDHENCKCAEPDWAESEFLSAGTWEDCAECKGLQNQSDIVECDGKSCGVLVHTYCALKVVAPDGEDAWLCGSCSAA